VKYYLFITQVLLFSKSIIGGLGTDERCGFESRYLLAKRRRNLSKDFEPLMAVIVSSQDAWSTWPHLNVI
jgi:hypothetical protein